MKFLTEELKKEIKEHVADLMLNSGIRVCMKQGAVGFENYIQVELAGWLKDKFSSKTVMVESDLVSNVKADIIVKEQKDSVDVLAVFQLKIVRLGTASGDGIKMERIRADIEKLRDFDLKNADKVLICSVYLYNEKIVETSWGSLNYGERNKDKRAYVREKSCDLKCKPFTVKGISACVDLFEVQEK